MLAAKSVADVHQLVTFCKFHYNLRSNSQDILLMVQRKDPTNMHTSWHRGKDIIAPPLPSMDGNILSVAAVGFSLHSIQRQ